MTSEAWTTSNERSGHGRLPAVGHDELEVRRAVEPRVDGPRGVEHLLARVDARHPQRADRTATRARAARAGCRPRPCPRRAACAAPCGRASRRSSARRDAAVPPSQRLIRARSRRFPRRAASSSSGPSSSSCAPARRRISRGTGSATARRGGAGPGARSAARRRTRTGASGSADRSHRGTARRRRARPWASRGRVEARAMTSATANAPSVQAMAGRAARQRSRRRSRSVVTGRHDEDDPGHDEDARRHDDRAAAAGAPPRRARDPRGPSTRHRDRGSRAPPRTRRGTLRAAVRWSTTRIIAVPNASQPSACTAAGYPATRAADPATDR